MNELLQKLVYDPRAPLLFNSGVFLCFFLLYLLLAGFIKKRLALRNLLLIVFSLYFYYKSSGYFFLLMIAMSWFAFYMAAAIGKAESLSVRKLLLVSTNTLLLGALGYFKYTNFFLLEVLPPMGIHAAAQQIFLPLGISFFTFELIAYVTDVYRKDYQPESSFTDFMVYVSFFPHLVAGPIVRPHEFFYQIKLIQPSDAESNSKGIFLLCMGLIKKCLISDYISLNYVDRIFDNPVLYSGAENLMGVYGYTVQIFCDFSGYTDMAMGIALMMGFTLPDNFAAPYLSVSVTEFWRRWHITLSSWLRDYLYIPLGGNRKGKFRQYLHLLLTMLLGGLWHGASLKFIAWGGLHGLMLALEKATGKWFSFIPSRLASFLGWCITFHFVAACWVFFRAADFATAAKVFEQTLQHFSWKLVPELFSAYATVYAMVAAGLLLSLVPVRMSLRAQQVFSRAGLLGQTLILFVVCWAVLQASGSRVQPFIYFQF